MKKVKTVVVVGHAAYDYIGAVADHPVSDCSSYLLELKNAMEVAQQMLLLVLQVQEKQFQGLHKSIMFKVMI